MDTIQLPPCTSCGFNEFELIDGHFYCTECNLQCANVIAIEYDEFAQGETQKSKIKVKKTKEGKNQSQEGTLLAGS